MSPTLEKGLEFLIATVTDIFFLTLAILGLIVIMSRSLGTWVVFSNAF